MANKDPLKFFEVMYICKVKRIAMVKARNPEQAKKKFDAGYFEKEFEIECIDIDDVRITASDDLPVVGKLKL
jgi:hypothetical protein